ncbi:MAG: response regulator transcription factor [Bacteroidetes bacterium]|nr:response regulator transcription factor [Bacteroidota bacterium]MBP6427516.1 response regulator transcription factor [Bacteroidia bacterium]
MKVLIVEDEKLSAEHLALLLSRLEPDYEVVHISESVKRTIAFLESGMKVDLIFMDIHLADGISFDIFEKVKETAPIIFTTAFDEYAIKAFKVNSVDYLLKPIGKAELRASIDKFKIMSDKVKSDQSEKLEETFNIINRRYKNRFMVRSGEQIQSIPVEEISFLISEDGIVILVTKAGSRFALDQSLDTNEVLLNPEQFFRISRKVIINFESINKIVSHLNSRLKIYANHLNEDDGIVSRERVGDFKLWLDR